MSAVLAQQHVDDHPVQVGPIGNADRKCRRPVNLLEVAGDEKGGGNQHGTEADFSESHVSVADAVIFEDPLFYPQIENADGCNIDQRKDERP